MFIYIVMTMAIVWRSKLKQKIGAHSILKRIVSIVLNSMAKKLFWPQCFHSDWSNSHFDVSRETVKGTSSYMKPQSAILCSPGSRSQQIMYTCFGWTVTSLSPDWSHEPIQQQTRVTTIHSIECGFQSGSPQQNIIPPIKPTCTQWVSALYGASFAHNVYVTDTQGTTTANYTYIGTVAYPYGVK